MLSPGEGILAEVYRQRLLGLVVVTTGAGGEAVRRLLAVPGASGTLLEVRVPYSYAAVEEMLGGPVDRSVSEMTAARLAVWARDRAATLLSGDGRLPVGLICTAAVRTNRERHGADHAWLGLATPDHVRTWHVDVGDRATREAQDGKLALWMLTALSAPLSDAALRRSREAVPCPAS